MFEDRCSVEKINKRIHFVFYFGTMKLNWFHPEFINNVTNCYVAIYFQYIVICDTL